MKKILLFGAGKSATVLIDYLLEQALIENWLVEIVDADLKLAQSKTGASEMAVAVSFNINDGELRARHIQSADMVISLLPPGLHFLVAKDCVRFNKNLLTASYVDDDIRTLQTAIEDKKLLFLCEMGLDPGIDHMSAMRIIDNVRAKGGKVTSFQSHCGGLVAPESDDNPWHYKISWNPRNIIMAGKAGNHYREKGIEKNLSYKELFSAERIVDIPAIGILSWYPNRDSLSYISLYGLDDADTFIRTTLRHPDFMHGWKNIIDLKLTDEEPQYETDGKTMYEIFKEHLEKKGFGDWLSNELNESFTESKRLMENLMKLMYTEQEAQSEREILSESLARSGSTNISEEEEIDTEEVKRSGATIAAHKMHDANLTLQQLFFLGLFEKETAVNKGLCSPADILQFAVEKKLALQPGDKDMIVMLHEIGYTLNGQASTVNSSLMVKGEDNLRTAIAKTVGLPLGIAAKLILNGTIQLKGLQIPTVREIYEPVLKELEQFDVEFIEEY
jgi:saccharopine dehydrogenase-like NADP-dependent oxidoreductase